MRRSSEVRADLERLALDLGRAQTPAAVVAVALRHSASVLRSPSARLVLEEGSAVSCWTLEDGSIDSRPVGEFEVALRDASGSAPGRAVQHRFSSAGVEGNALVCQGLHAAGGFFMLAVGRPGRRRFDPAFRSALERLVSLVVPALRNAELVSGLRLKADASEHLAAHDPLTGLPNRLHFQEAAETAVANGLAGAVLLIDLDRFKEVNDTLGHQVGDELLSEVALRIRGPVGHRDLIARLGGDEFAVLLGPASTAEVVQLAQRIHRCLERPVEIGEFAVDVGASIGVALVAPGHKSLGDLLRRADVAMYAAKEARCAIEVYSPDLDHYRPEALALVPRFRGAVENDELHVAFQAQIDADSGQIVGAEALARWSVTGHGPIPPTEFIPVAESTGLIHPLTHRVMGEAIGQCVSWQFRGEPLRVSVNISPRVLVEPGFADRIIEQLHLAGLPPQCLRVEVTETTMMVDPPRAVAALHELSERGISVAIDDFGTGHSSLSYLTTLPCNELKIDRSFISALEADDRRAAAVVAAIIGLGHDLGIDVVAEGVETPRSADQLRQMGCRVLQGFLFGRPVSATEFSRVLMRAGEPGPTQPLHSRTARRSDPASSSFRPFGGPDRRSGQLPDAPPRPVGATQ